MIRAKTELTKKYQFGSVVPEEKSHIYTQTLVDTAVVAHVYVSTLENTTLFLLRLYVSLTMHDIVSLYSLLFKNNIICFSFGI